MDRQYLIHKVDLVRSNKAEKSGITQSWEKQSTWTVSSECHTAEGQQQQGQRTPVLVGMTTKEHSIQNPRHSKDVSGRYNQTAAETLSFSVIYQNYSPCYSQLPLKQLFLNKANPNPAWSEGRKILGLEAGPERSSSLCMWLHCCQQSF